MSAGEEVSAATLALRWLGMHNSHGDAHISRRHKSAAAVGMGLVSKLLAGAIGVILGFLLFAAMPVVVPFFVPMSRFYELRSVTISGADYGTSPRMLVDRTIYRDFRGRYEVQILEEAGGELVPYWGCGPHASDWRTYRQEARLPADLNLDWWMDIPPNRECMLDPGRYKIITTVYAQTWFGTEVSTELGSNIFEIRKPK